MTTDHADGPDETLAAVTSLRKLDVSQRRARAVRRRCHVLLRAQSDPKNPAAVPNRPNGMAFRRVIGPALGGAWCLAYLVEIVRRAAAVFFGAQ